MRSKLVEFLLGISAPAVVAGGWVVISMQGLTLIEKPTAAQLAWRYGGLATGFVGYALLGLASYKLWKRYPVFSRTCAVTGVIALSIQLTDLAV